MPTVIDYYDFANGGQYQLISGVYLANDTGSGGIYQTVNIDSDVYAINWSVKLQKHSSPSGYLKCAYAEVDSHTDSNDTHLGTFIEVSTTEYAMVNISTSATVYNFTFSGTNLLEAGHFYSFLVYCPNATTIDTTNKISFCEDISSSTADGRLGYWQNTASSFTLDSTSADLCYYLYGDTESQAEEEPNIINEIIDLVILISVPLILILFCGGLGYQFGGGFGGLVGVNVGVLLSVLFLSWPLYTLVLLVMVDIYAVFKGGNI